MAAGYTTSLLLNAQALLAKRFEKPEFRVEPYNLIKTMLEGGKGLFSQGQIDDFMTSDSRVVETYCKGKRTVTPGSARAHDHTLAAFGDTQNVQLSFSIVTGTYGISLKMGGRNVFERAELLAGDLLSAQQAINNTIEIAIAAYLAAQKNQINAASGSYSAMGEWDGTNYVWKIPVAAKEYMFQYISAIMAINDYDMPLTLIADPYAGAVAGQLAKQGQANATNLGWQFENQSIVQSRRVTDSSYLATVYAIPTGTVGMVNRIPKENRDGVATRLYNYGSMADVCGTPLLMATHEYEAGASTYGTGGETQDVTSQIENSTDYALVHAPLSASANYSPIFKFVLEG